MVNALDPLGLWLWLATAQATLCLGVGLLLGRGLHRRPAGAHRRLTAAAGAALLAPALSAVSLGNGWGVVAGPPAPVVYRVAGESVTAPVPTSAWVARGLAAAWGVGAVVLLGRLGRSLLRGRRVVRGAAPVLDPAALGALGRAAAAVGVRHLPRVLAAGGVGPLLWRWAGWPAVVVPHGPAAAGVSWDPVFRHELAHLRRGDPWTGLLAEVVAAVFWWHPLAGRVRAELVLAAEFACDDWAMAAGPFEYVEALLALSPRKATGYAPAAGGLLARRVRRVLLSDGPGPEPAGPGGRGWLVALAGAVAAAALVAAACPGQ